MCKWMTERPFQRDFDDITISWIHVNIINLIISLVVIFLIVLNIHNYIRVVTSARIKLALFLVHSGNNVLLDEVLSKSVTYWENIG